MTHFEREIREQPGVLAWLLQDPTVRDVAEELRTRAPCLITTLARGSSDNAVTFLLIWQRRRSACPSPACRPVS